MMGHRDVRLVISYPEISEDQAQAIFEASVELINEGKKPHPEIMVPVTCDVSELDFTRKLLINVMQKFVLNLG